MTVRWYILKLTKVNIWQSRRKTVTQSYKGPYRLDGSQLHLCAALHFGGCFSINWAIEKKPLLGNGDMLYPGLYEQVINRQLHSALSEISKARQNVAPIDKAEASRVLAQYLADIVQKGLDNVLDNGGDISTQVSLANQIITLIQTQTQEADFAALGVDQRAEQLLALLRENDPRLAVGKTAADLSRPETSIAQSSLFTGAIHEPQMYTELKKEIVSADRIDTACAWRRIRSA